MRRVALAITIALQPRLLLLDEPTSCLDPTGRRILKRLLSRYRVEGRTVVIASHETAFLSEVCDRVVWLRDGAIDAVVNTSGGELEVGVEWPEATPPPLLALQDELAAMGLPVIPRALTVGRFIERLNVR
jgi:energy-coupling factor transporter ATP-binding protein EcfA2